ncbi:hypothetical protein G4Y79_06300 [Phototrophicus methaneseepsis]|uniref:CobQ/CobB/MinD/ParA nucleotide binding domain-containing protein n=1 Tax=Phototrophicus methaneseepsis TaxID=2710758 RepID=A0A7S8EBQ3_9CHLR|nr:tyrosine-protein kinase domain-containing protein [Phototrophicus methaneseepsis]QPC83987.1 hypothetical protein G4Y79_06300 [Phototrophicus methaneseepsis]
MENEGVRYINLIIRRLWIIVLAALITGGATYFLYSRQAPSYTSEARLLIGNVISAPNPNVNTLELSERLAILYLELVRSRETLVPAIEELGLDISYEDFNELIGASIVPDTPILIIDSVYDDPYIAADIANTVAQKLIETAPTDLTPEEESRLTLIGQQIDDLQEQIASTRQQAADILGRIEEAQEIEFLSTESLLMDQYNMLSDRIVTSQQTLAQLLDAYLALSEKVNSLEVLEAAEPNLEETGISPIIIGAAGAVVGIILATSLVLLLDYTNRSIRTEVELRRALSLPVMASVPSIRTINNQPTRYKVVRDMPNSTIAEDFRSMRTSLLFSKESSLDETASNRESRVYLISSTRGNEGRTFIAANLALSIAETGARVLLVDSDIRNPKLHQVFELSNDKGLATLLTEARSNPKIFQKNATDDFLDCINIQSVPDIGSLDVVACGATPDTLSPHIIGFENIERTIERLIDIGNYNVILFDSPPAMDYADGYTLAAKVNASALIVIEASRTDRAEAMQVRDQFMDMGLTLTGTILNKT